MEEGREGHLDNAGESFLSLFYFALTPGKALRTVPQHHLRLVKWLLFDAEPEIGGGNGFCYCHD